MTINEKINQMTVEQKALLFSGWTITGGCNDFGITPKGKCDHNCETCFISWLESEAKEPTEYKEFWVEL